MATSLIRGVARTSYTGTSCAPSTLFAHLKCILKLDRLRLRGPDAAKDEFLLAGTVQNPHKMAKLVPTPAPMAPA